MANVQVDAVADIAIGARVVIRDSNDFVYVLVNAGGNIRAYKGNVAGEPASFAEQDAVGAPNSADIVGIAAAIDSAGLIHVMYYFDDTVAHGSAPNIRYAQFRSSAHVTTQDVWVLINEEISAMTNADGDFSFTHLLAIAIDANDDPHATWSDEITDMGSQPELIFYDNRIGGTWGGRIEVERQTLTADIATSLDLMIADPASSVNADRPIIILTNISDNAVNVFHGTTLNATAFTKANDVTGAIIPSLIIQRGKISIAIDSNEKITVTFIENTSNDLMIVEHLNSNPWGTWETPVDVDTTRDYGHPSIAIDGTNRYIFVEHANDNDIHLWKDVGAGFVEETADADLPNVGTFADVKVKWANFNNNSPRELDYVFEDSGGAVQYNTFQGAVGFVTRTKTFTLDAILQAIQQKTFALDGILKAVQTKTFLLDAILLATQTKTFILDAILKATQTKTFSLDGILQQIRTKTFLLDAILKATQQKTFSLDGILKAIQQKTFSLDAILKAVQQKTFTIDAILEAPVTIRQKTFTLDGILKAVQRKTFTLDGVLQQVRTKIFSLDAILQQIRTKTFTIDARLINRRTKTFSIDSILKAVQTKIFSLDAILQSTFTKTFSLDAILKAVQAKTFSIDAILKATQQKTFSLDGILVIVRTKTFLLDAILKATQTKTFSLDGILKAVQQKTFSLDAILTAVRQKSFSLDGILKAIQQKTFTINARLINRRTKIFSLDAILQQIRIKIFTLDAVLQQTVTKIFTMDGILKVIQQKIFSLDAVLKATQTKTFSFDAILFFETQKTISGKTRMLQNVSGKSRAK